MVKLMIPHDTCKRVLFFQGNALSPFKADGTFSGDLVEVKSTLNSLEEHRGIFGENECLHKKLIANVEYSPLALGCLANPTTQYPRQCKVPVKGYALPEYIAKFGLVFDKTATYGYTLADRSQAEHWAFERNVETGVFRARHVISVRNQPYMMLACEDHVFAGITPQGNNLYKVVTYVTQPVLGASGQSAGINLSQLQSYDAIMSLAPQPPSDKWNHFPSTTYCYAYEVADSVPRYSTADAIGRKIDDVVSKILPSGFPIEDYNFGDLAGEAAKSANRVNVNMIAFLRDLRNPSEMIPKLKNLKSLKGISSNFLSVDYGILPTLSDINRIISAAKKYHPYLDKNGFVSLTAGHTQEQVDASFQLKMRLEQHIKLAVGSEDNGFELLLEQLDSFGVLPTFENLWDLIPYSFVVDWFVGVGDLLERVDTRLRLMRFNIRYATMSRKEFTSGYLPQGIAPEINGDFEWVMYHRWVEDQAPLPPLSLGTTSGDFHHWVESGALIVQRL